MVLTVLTHIALVRILFVIGITLTVLPIFFYKLILKGKKYTKAASWATAIGVVCCIPMLYYFYADIRYGVGDFSNNDKLYLAAENKNIDAAEFFVSEGADPQGENRYGRSAIYRAVELDNTQMVRLFLNNGCDPNYTAEEKVTLLGIACRNQSMDNVRMLLEAGAKPDYNIDSYVPAIHYACAYDEGYNAELIALLLEYGADPASKSYRNGKVMLPFRYYFDRHYDDDELTDEDELNYAKIEEMLYEPYIEWLNEKLIAENLAED